MYMYVDENVFPIHDCLIRRKKENCMKENLCIIALVEKTFLFTIAKWPHLPNRSYKSRRTQPTNLVNLDLKLWCYSQHAIR